MILKLFVYFKQMLKIFQKAYRIDLLWQLVKTNFKMRYQNSILGIMWVVIKPYATFFVMFTIWSSFSGQNIENYSIYLLLGIITYTFFQELIVFGQMALLERAHIILKISFPRQIAITSALINALINLGINMVFALFILVSRGIKINIEGILYYLFIVLTIFTFALGFSFFTSILTIRFRDLKNIFDLGLFVLLWATPIFYSLESNQASGISSLVKYNPLGILINQVRAAFGIYGEIDFQITFIFFILSILFTLLGWRYFSKQVKKIAEHF